MPNIGTLPTAQQLLTEEPGAAGQYGAHLQWEKDGTNVVLLTASSRSVLAQGTVQAASVDLRLVDAQTVPYVNAFIAHTGQRVEKYWRTKQYRLVGLQPAVATKQEIGVASTAPAISTAPGLAAPQPIVHPGPVLTTIVDEHGVHEIETAKLVEVEDPNAPIPGVEHPAKVKVKSRGKGWTQVGEIVTTDEAYQTLVDAWTLRQNGVPSSVLITGPAGTAKTALVRSFAASLGVPFLKVDGGAIRTADDWAGAFRQDPNTKVWAHRWSPFAKVLMKGEPTIVLIDEINRTESPQALNSLLGLLDWTGQLLVPDANTTLNLPPGVLVVATANIGPEFVGTLPIDGAVRQRFPYGVRMGYPAERIEIDLIADLTSIDKDVAGRLVRMAAAQRVNREDPQQYPSGSVISTRVILDIARRIATCSTAPREAVWATLRGQFDPGDERALSIVVDAQFPAPVDESLEAVEVDEDDAQGEANCPSCGHPNPIGKATCDYCGYALPTKPGTIQLQNVPYGTTNP